MRLRWRVVTAVLSGLLLLALPGCSSPPDVTPRVDEDSILVGSFAFPESRVLAEVYAQALEAAGYPVDRGLDLGPREIVEPALEQGLVDVVPEYAGTALSFLAGRTSTEPRNPEQTLEQLRAAFASRGVTALQPAPARNENVLVVTADSARHLDITTVSELAPRAGALRFGGPPECPERPFCLPGFRSVYGLEFREFRPLDLAGPRTIAALESGDIDVALLFSTHPMLESGELVALEDDRALQPADHIVPVVRQEVLARHGAEVAEVLNEVSARLTTPAVRQLNRRVMVDNQPVSQVAAEWLRAEGLRR